MKDKLHKLRHTGAHILAQAVTELFPKVKLGIGPVIENGFYYDFDKKEGFSPKDLKKIEKRMKEIVKENLKLEKSNISKIKAKKILKSEKYKLELVNDLPGKEVTFYKQGNFQDLCKGPHAKSTGEVKYFKILKTAGAYWKGSEKNQMLQRIYVAAFETKKELENYLNLLEEAKKRDHRKIGVELELFMFHKYSPGSPFFYPKGTFIYNKLVELIRNEYSKRGYDEIITPQIYENKLWKTSGHWDKYQEDMFTLRIDKKEFAIKPMNCPGHMLVYKSKIRSYRDLPLRLADFSVLHRNELKGVLGGLTRVRKFSQDDAHIFVTPDQLENEVGNVLEFVDHVYKDIFKFEYSISLSTMPEKAMGDKNLWNKAEKSLKSILKKKKLKFEIKEEEGAFYGPKIDFDIKDFLGRSWQLATIQLDFQMPLNFKLSYESKNGTKETPIVIHRAILGSLERFIGVLLEHTAGKLPLWLSPTQISILTVNDSHKKFAKEVIEKLEKNNIRVNFDDRNQSIGKKVRESIIQKIPFAVTIGDKEVKSKKLAIRSLDGKLKFGVSTDKFINDLLNDIEHKC
jgi:threonyl-tRNA synthetase